MKKTILMILATSSLLFGDYYSSIDLTLKDTKTMKFEDEITLNIKNSKISINSKYDLNYLLDGKNAKQYQPTVFTIQEEIQNPDPLKQDEIIIVPKQISYSTYNLKYILKNNILDREFILKTSSGLKLVELDKDTTSIETILNYNQNVTKYKYVVKQSFDNNGTSKKVKEDEILTKYINNNGDLVAIEFLDNGVKNILKVENAKLQQFIDEKSSRVVTVEKFDFKKDKMYLSYVSNTSSSSKRLNVTYEMKKKNIKTVLESPISLFDPESKSSQIEQNVGILRNYKNKELYEIKKVQLVDGKSDASWLNHPKKRVVVLNYITDGAKDKSVLSKSKGQQFYGIEGLFYLASWMDTNDIKSKVFTFINGLLPFDVTMVRTKAHYFEMQKSGQTIFSFIVNKDGFVTKMQYPNYDLTLNLESIENDTTLRNKQFLKDFKEQNSIRLIKEK